MKDKTLSFIVLFVVIVHILTLTTLVLFPPIFNIGDPETMMEYTLKFAGLSSGLVGLIVGYYLGRKRGA